MVLGRRMSRKITLLDASPAPRMTAQISDGGRPDSPMDSEAAAASSNSSPAAAKMDLRLDIKSMVADTSCPARMPRLPCCGRLECREAWRGQKVFCDKW